MPICGLAVLRLKVAGVRELRVRGDDVGPVPRPDRVPDVQRVHDARDLFRTPFNEALEKIKISK